MTHFEAKRIWKIAAVMGERRARMDRAAETAEKLKVMDRTIVQSYGNVMKREATLLYKEQVQSERKQNALKKEHEMMQTKRLDFDEKLEVSACM